MVASQVHLLALLWLFVSLALPASAQQDNDMTSADEEGSQAPLGMQKRQRERSQFVPYTKYAPREPTCEQLRAMWKLSKRQHRNAVMTNAMPRYQEPFLFGRVHDTLRHNPLYDPPKPRPQPTYGTIVHSPQEHSRKFETPALDELIQIMRSPRPSTSGRDSIRELRRLLGPPTSSGGSQGLTGQYGRIHHYPRPSQDRHGSKRLFRRSVPSEGTESSLERSSSDSQGVHTRHQRLLGV